MAPIRTLPEAVADHGHTGRIRPLIIRSDDPSPNGRDTHHREIIGRHHVALDDDRLPVHGGRRSVEGHEADERRDGSRVLAEIGEHRPRHRQPDRSSLAVLAAASAVGMFQHRGRVALRLQVPEHHQPRRVRDWQIPQRHGVDDAEDCGVRPDAERERQHDDGRQCRSAPHLPDSVTNVVKDAGEGFSARCHLSFPFSPWTEEEAGPLADVRQRRRRLRGARRSGRAVSDLPGAGSSRLLRFRSHFSCTWAAGVPQSTLRIGGRLTAPARRRTRGSQSVSEDGVRARRVRVRRESGRPARGVGCRASAGAGPAAGVRPLSGGQDGRLHGGRDDGASLRGDPREDRPGVRQAGPARRQVQGRPRGLLRRGQEGLGHRLPWDKEKGIVTVAVAEGECGCPLVDSKRTPAFCCNCSVGYQKESFETVFGRPVQATLKESKLGGSKRCVFEVRLS